MTALRRLRWWAADYAYAAVWQVRALFRGADAESFASGRGATIIVLPGVYETWRFLQPLVAAMHDRGHAVHVLEVLAHSRPPVTEMADQVTRYLHEHDLHEVILVAHSKGGLAGKQVMLGPEGRRVHSMLAIATPFGGSRYARRMPVRTLRALAPEDPAILALAGRADVNARIVSVYARFDPHIPEGSELPGAKNVSLDTGGHFRVLAHPRVMAELASLAE